MRPTNGTSSLWLKWATGVPYSKPYKVVQNCGTIFSPALALVSAPAFCCVSEDKFSNL